MDNKNERKHYIDIARGVAIILVVMGHAVNEYSLNSEPLEKIIYSFHMPLFFIISGLVFRVKDGDTFPAFFKKRSKGLMLPYLLFAALITLANIAQSVILKAPSAFFDLLKTKSGIIHTLLLTNHGAFSNLWFLPSMLVAQALLFIVLKYVKNKYAAAALCFLPSIIVIFISPKISLPLCFESAVVSVMYLYAGVLANKTEFVEKSKYAKLIIFAVIFALYSAIYLTKMYELRLSYYEVQFGSPLLFLATSFSGSMLVIELSYIIKHCKILEILGRYSLYIFGFHYIIQNALRIALDFLNINIGDILTLIITTVLNLLISTALAIVWIKIKNKMRSKND